jgi:hypothetical protein
MNQLTTIAAAVLISVTIGLAAHASPALNRHGTSQPAPTKRPYITCTATQHWDAASYSCK